MTDELFLSPTDVAEALNCELADVMTLIDSLELPATKRRGWRISHSDLARYVIESQRAAWELGQTTVPAPSLVASRPFDSKIED